MFAFLRGIVARKTATHVELDVNGVGYQIYVPQSVHRRLMVDSPATFLTYCHIREDVFQIFGFLRDDERALFTTLLGISGIGPKAALAVLSGLTVSEFGRAILESDVVAFTKVPGIGKKGAQRIVLEMKAKLGQDAELSEILGEKEVIADEGDDVVAALVTQGCTLAEAQKAAARARKSLGEDARDEDVLVAAFRSLAKV